MSCDEWKQNFDLCQVQTKQFWDEVCWARCAGGHSQPKQMRTGNAVRWMIGQTQTVLHFGQSVRIQCSPIDDGSSTLELHHFKDCVIHKDCSVNFLVKFLTLQQ